MREGEEQGSGGTPKDGGGISGAAGALTGSQLSRNILCDGGGARQLLAQLLDAARKDGLPVTACRLQPKLQAYLLHSSYGDWNGKCLSTGGTKGM